ncbi:MAG: single-stranded-DNA-specific exonuclease RecJ [Bacilli bacterium]
MINTNLIIKNILNNRGYYSDEEIEEFLSSKPKETFDPFLLLNMEAGVDLIIKKIEENKKICIYGDYDADGITSICVLMSVFNSIGANVIYYIPSRFDEGYGLNIDAIDSLHSKGVDLIITVDCGTVSFNEVLHAQNLGMDVVVTDHHRVTDIKADCILINPKQEECQYPFKELAGCGVAFKLAQALQFKIGFSKSVIMDVLDFVAIGTIGDIVPLVGENRTIVKYGVSKINKYRRKSISTLINSIYGKKVYINSEKISFGIVPHLNAAGRIKDAKIGVQLFLSDDINEIERLSAELVTLNSIRKEKQKETYDQCISLYKEQCAEEFFPVIYAKEAHEGITGIVAGKIKDDLGRPVAIVTDQDEQLKGTSRGIEGVDVYETFKALEEFFIQFGGHKGACGFRIHKTQLPYLRSGLKKYFDGIDISEFDCEMKFDDKLLVSQATNQLVVDLNILEPFGQSNPKPKFLFNGVTHSGVRLVGKYKEHLAFKISDGENRLSCILFNKGKEAIDVFSENTKINVYGELSINTGFDNSVQVIVDKIGGYDEF